MQPLSEIEEAYKTPDPWGFKSNPDDAVRKQNIISACRTQRLFYEYALEIGAGEGWITRDLPAAYKYGFEISSNARNRMPPDVTPLADVPFGLKFELVVVPGCLYSHYDTKRFFQIIRDNAKDVVVTSNIKAWEHRGMSNRDWLHSELGLCQVSEMEFPYRTEFIQKLRVLRKI